MTALERYALLEALGDYYDGETARPREVIVKFGEASLILLTTDDTPIVHWALASLRALPSGSNRDELRIVPSPDSDERLTIRDRDMVDAIREVCPDLDRRPRDRGAVPKVVFWGGGAVGAVLLIVFVLVPAIAGQLSQLIPPEQEQRLGERIVDQIVQLLSLGDETVGFCHSPEGDAALARMQARLEPHADAHLPITLRVIDHPLVNAFAAPGGQIVVFRGLLENAAGPDEVAGVIAHEVGHVANRDPIREALRAAGSAGVLGLLMGDFIGGGAIVAMSETVMRANYQQDAEANADKAATQILGEAGVSTAPFADFFARLRDQHGDMPRILSHLASHPALAEREAAARAADVTGGKPYTPTLSDRDWLALQSICD